MTTSGHTNCINENYILMLCFCYIRKYFFYKTLTFFLYLVPIYFSINLPPIHPKIEKLSSILNLVIILNLVCKLYPGRVTVMIILLMEFFYPPQLLTKFEGNGMCVSNLRY